MTHFIKKIAFYFPFLVPCLSASGITDIDVKYQERITTSDSGRHSEHHSILDYRREIHTVESLDSPSSVASTQPQNTPLTIDWNRREPISPIPTPTLDRTNEPDNSSVSSAPLSITIPENQTPERLDLEEVKREDASTSTEEESFIESILYFIGSNRTRKAVTAIIGTVITLGTVAAIIVTEYNKSK